MSNKPIIEGNCYILKLKDSRNIACVCIELETKLYYKLINQETKEVSWALKTDFGFNSDGYRVLEDVTEFVSKKLYPKP